MSNPSAAFLQNARNCDVRFENTTINVAGENVISNQLAGPYGSELQQLLQYCLLDCLVDSKEQYDAPQCEPETRVAMVQQIDDWAQSRDGKSGPLMWLRGGAGAGKSTLAQTIAMKYKREGMLVLSFFFSNRKANRSDGNALILTLVVQLIEIFPSIAPSIFQVIKKNPTILSRSPEEHMKHLFVGPLNALHATGPHPLFVVQLYLIQFGLLLIFTLQSVLGPILGRLPHGYSIFQTSITAPKPTPTLIVIDGLDECNDPAIQRKLLHVIATAIPQIPQPLRFLIASRPEAHIIQTFEQENLFSILPVQQLDLSSARDADEDIGRYLRSRFAAIRQSHPFGKHLPEDWPSFCDLNSLIHQSSGHFIYPSTVMAFIEDPTDFPHQRLKEVLNMTNQTSAGNPLGPLDALYQHMFSRIKKSHLPVILIFFGVMCIRSRVSWRFREHDIWERVDRRAMDQILQLDEGHLDVMIQPLRSLVHIPSYDSDASDAQPMRCFHASLFDFLLDPARSGTLHINLGLAHEAVATFIVRYLFEESTGSIGKTLNTSMAFLDHSCNAVISGNFLPSYLQTCHYFYQTVFPLRYDTSVQLYIDFLHAVSRKDIDPSGQLRFQHIRQITQKYGEHAIHRSRASSTHSRSGDPTFSTDHVVELLLKAKDNFAGIFKSICFVLSYWCPNVKVSSENIHPGREFICQQELKIFTLPSQSYFEIWTFRCGSLLHVVLLGSYACNAVNIMIITYDAKGRSFQTYHTSSVRGLTRSVVRHLRKCDALLKKGDEAPWSVNLRRLMDMDSGDDDESDDDDQVSVEDADGDEEFLNFGVKS